MSASSAGAAMGTSVSPPGAAPATSKAKVANLEQREPRVILEVAKVEQTRAWDDSTSLGWSAPECSYIFLLGGRAHTWRDDVKQKRCAIYTRVSTAEQSTKAQEGELKEYAGNRGWTITRIYADKISGATNSRPALDELMKDAQRRRFDLVAVWRFDRFARSVSHLLQALETFKGLGIEFISLSEQIDTSTPTGKMVFTVLGAVAELERSLIAERVRSGLANAKRNGKTLGRPPIRKLTAAEIENIRSDRASGKFSLRRLATKYRASLWAMQQATAGRKRGA
jgi:DNA invertase Pin-like site-specific DNA recombinase